MSSEGNRTRFSGWTPSKRDLFEQWLCRELDQTPCLYIPRAGWCQWLDRQWRDWRDMEIEIGFKKI